MAADPMSQMMGQMMSQTMGSQTRRLVLNCKGLILSPGELSREPGALIVADNVNIEAPGIIRSRQGLARQTNDLGGPIWKLLSTKELSTNLIANHGSATTAAGLSYGDGSSAWTAINDSTGSTAGVANAPENRMRGVVCGNNHYLTSTLGVKRLESNYVVFNAGMPKALPLDLTGPTAVLTRAKISLLYTALTGNFTNGLVVTGGTSGAHGTISIAPANGATGTLTLSGVSGTFTAGEIITDTSTGSATAGTSSANGFIVDHGVTAYRHTWCKKDADGIVMEGAPSGKTVVYNNAGTTGYAAGLAANIVCRILLPKETGTVGTPLTTAYFFKLYRSDATIPGPDGLSLPSSDDMALVAEQYITAGNISAGYVEITDTTTDVFRLINGERLYTNTATNGGDPTPNEVDPTTPGIVMSNDPPPVAKDIVLFAECAFYGNISYRHKLQFQLLSVSSGQGLQTGDVFTVTPPVSSTTFTITAIAPGAPSNGQFVVYTAALPSENAERTALNFCEAVNKCTTNDSVWAYYTPSADKGFGEGFGKITLESRGDTGPNFTLTVSAHPTAYSPQLTGGLASAADIFPNGVAYSKPGQADAVPPISFQKLGRDDTNILKMHVLRDSLYIFTDDGLYRLDGRTQDDFSINEFELSFRLLGPEMSVVCDDAIYAWGIEGFAKITSSGVSYISNSIEPYIWQTVNDLGLTWLKTYGFATAYRNRHKVMWAFPDTNSNKNCKYMLVYDTRMGAWSRWVFLAGNDINTTTGHSCGVVRASDDFLFLGQWNATASNGSVFKERRAYTSADFIDDTYNTSTKGIQKIVTWSATTPSPEMMTLWDEFHVFWDVSPTISAWTTPTAASVTFTSDMSSASANNGVAPTALSRMSRLLVSQLQRRSSRMVVSVRHTVASEYFGLEGMAFVYLPPEGTATVRT